MFFIAPTFMSGYKRDVQMALAKIQVMPYVGFPACLAKADSLNFSIPRHECRGNEKFLR
jgi:hypothetical protein